MDNNQRILLVDDENMLLDSLEIILSMNGYTVMGKANDGVAAMEILKNDYCDLALVDLNMKGMGGIELIGKMKKQYPTVKILVLTTFYDDNNITEAISGGADGYLLKDSGREAILGAIKQLMGGNTVLDSKVMQRLTALVGKSDNRDISAELTEREREICALVADGLSNRQIAEKLYISEGTVKNYMSVIYDKTGIHDRVQLAISLRGL